MAKYTLTLECADPAVQITSNATDVPSGTQYDISVTVPNEKFTLVPQLNMFDSDGMPSSSKFTLNDDSTVATLSIIVDSDSEGTVDDYTHVPVQGGAGEITPNPNVPPNTGGDISPFLNLYKMGIKYLIPLANAIHRKNSIEEGHNTEIVNLNDFIVSFREYFFDVPANAEPEVVNFGGNKLETVQGNRVTDSLYTLEFGTATIPTHNNSITDYKSEVSVYLPFIGIRQIASEYIGKKIELRYIIDIATGEGIAVLSSDGVPFDFIDCEPFVQVTYSTKSNGENITYRIGDNNNKHLLSKQPYIIVKWYTQVDSTDMYTVNKRGEIGTFKGLNQFDEIELISNGDILSLERDLLISELKTGVIIE